LQRVALPAVVDAAAAVLLAVAEQQRLLDCFGVKCNLPGLKQLLLLLYVRVCMYGLRCTGYYPGQGRYKDPVRPSVSFAEYQAAQAAKRAAEGN
jgi:hypothetical protein